MRTFYCDPSKKKARIERAKRHVKDNRLKQGSYGNEEESTACSVGCDVFDLVGIDDLDKYDIHSFISSHDGVPVWVECARDVIFEGLSAKAAIKWHVELAEAIPVGAQLSHAYKRFLAELFNPQGRLVSAMIQGSQGFSACESIRELMKEVYMLMLDEVHDNIEIITTTRILSLALRASSLTVDTNSSHGMYWALKATSQACQVLELIDRDESSIGYSTMGIVRGLCELNHIMGTRANAETQANYKYAADKLLHILRTTEPTT